MFSIPAINRTCSSYRRTHHSRKHARTQYIQAPPTLPQTAANTSAQGIKLVLSAEALQARLEDQIPFAKEVCLLDEYLRVCSFEQHDGLFII